MTRALTLLAMGAVLGACEPLPVDEGELLFADDFDRENGAQGKLDYDAFEQWDVIEGSVDLIGNGMADVLPGEGLYVDLDGAAESAGTLVSQRVFDLQPGRYLLSLELAGPQEGDDDSLLVSVRDVALEFVEVPAGHEPSVFEWVLKVDEATVADIELGASGSDDQGILLLGVVLERLPERRR